jgi:hypothetical protein
MSDPSLSEYNRGVAAGTTDRTLQEHSERLDKLNGSMADLAKATTDLRIDMVRAVNGLAGEIRQLASSAAARSATVDAQRESDKGTVEATAEALEKAETSRAAALVLAREKSDQRWSPFQRLLAVLGTLAAVVTVIYYFTHPHG